KIAPGDIDSFTFTLAAGTGALWTVGETIENGFAPRLIVLDPTGSSLFNGFNARGDTYALPFNTGASPAGTYTALVLDATGGASGEYALTGVAGAATQVTDDDSGTLVPGQPRAGALPPGDADVYTV